MARIRVVFDGRADVNGSPLLMHNDRLSDPINPYTRWSKEISSKTKKTDQEHEELGRREFLGAGYWRVDDGPGSKQSDPVIPTWNIVRCLQEGATRRKKGKAVIQGIVPIEDQTTLIYKGPRDAQALWDDGTFKSRMGAGVNRSKIIRTRPSFVDWVLEVELELDLEILDPDVVNIIARDAGRYTGLGDNRPRFGRFLGSAALIAESPDLLAPELLDAARSRAADKTARASIEAADKVHAERHPNGKEKGRRIREKAGE